MLSPDKVQNLPLELPQLPPEMATDQPPASQEEETKRSLGTVRQLGLCAMMGIVVVTGAAGEDAIHAVAHAIGHDISTTQEDRRAESMDGDLLEVVQTINGERTHTEESPVEPDEADKILTLTIPFDEAEKSPTITKIEGGRAPVKPASMPSLKLPFNITASTKPNNHPSLQ